MPATGSVCAVLVICLTAHAQSHDSELERQGEAFIAKVFTKCSDSIYYFGPHEANHLSCGATGRDVTDCAEVIEYKDLTFKTRELQLSDVEVRAGITKKAVLLTNYVSSRSRMRVTYSKYFNSPPVSTEHRDGVAEWDPWEKPILNTMPSTSGEYVQRVFGVMTRKEGQWTFAPGPDFPLEPSLSQVLGRVGLNGGPVADQAAELMRGLGPGAVLSPLPELRAMARIIEKIESQKPRSCAALFPREWPGRLPPMVAPGTPMTPWARAMLHPPKFAGTAKQFAASFPDLLKQAGEAAGFDAQAYQKESTFVTDSVRRCAGITPAMAAQATTPGPLGSGQVVTRRLGEEYAVCQAGGSSPANAHYPDTRIVFQLNSGAGRNWQQGTGFSVFVFFMRAKQGNYPVVFATIRGPE